MARIRSNFFSGTLSSQLLAGATTLMSTALSSFPEVTGSDVAYLVIDPEGSTPEIVKVTAHAVSDTSATVVRGQESTTDRTWPAGTSFIQAPIASDVDATTLAADAAFTGSYAPLSGSANYAPMAGSPYAHPFADRFLPTAVGAGVKRASATESWLLQRIGPESYLRWKLTQPSGLPGSNLVHQVTSADVASPMLSLDDSDASVVRTGTWTSGSNAGAYGGGYYQSSTAGDVVTWTTPANTTKVGVRIVKTSNAGIVKVSIDGDLTRATMLPTAQDLVDNGIAASTVLVANGGTLNPTDRVYDSYLGVGNFDVLVGLADDLDPAAHTVVLTVTGYKRSAASAARLYISGVMYALPQTTLTTASTELCPMATVIDGTASSALEYAFQVTPSGASTATFVGCVHGYEVQTAISFALDGVTLAQADGDLNMGTRLVVTKTTTLRHPEVGSGATVIATKSTTYTVDTTGLTVSHSTTWATAGTASAAYQAMFPVSNEWLRGGLDTAAAINLYANDGTYKLRRRGRCAAVWQRNGYHGAVMFLPDPETTLNGWAASGVGSTGAAYLSIEDRALTGYVNKMYATRVSPSVSPVAYAASDVWQSTAVYRVRRFVNLADTVLSAAA